MPGSVTQGEESWTLSQAAALVERIAPKIARVEGTHASTRENDSNYLVDIKVVGDLPSFSGASGEFTPLGEAGAEYERINVGFTMPGEGRGLQEGDLVVVGYLDGESEDPVVISTYYHDRNQAIQIQPGDWRNKFESAVIDIIEGGTEVYLGKQTGGRGTLDAGVFIDIAGGGLEIIDETGAGICIRDGLVYVTGFGTGIVDDGTPGTGGGTGGSGGVPGTGSGGGGIDGGGFPAPTSGQPAPPALSQTDWEPVFEDHFDSGSLDTRKWSIGFGWGMTTTGSPEVINASEVNFRDSNLVITASHNGQITAGSIHTKNKAAYGPGHYWEARIKMPNRQGYLPAFWSKPNSEAWPPEIDFVEILGDINTSAHHIHYVKGGGAPNGPHGDWCDGCNNNTGVDLSQAFHVYGCEWQQNAIRFYVDGKQVHEVTNGDVLRSCNRGAPFYTMLNIHVDRVGTTDKSEPWPEEMLVDYMRVFRNR